MYYYASKKRLCNFFKTKITKFTTGRCEVLVRVHKRLTGRNSVEAFERKKKSNKYI